MNYELKLNALKRSSRGFPPGATLRCSIRCSTSNAVDRIGSCVLSGQLGVEMREEETTTRTSPKGEVETREREKRERREVGG